MSHPRTLIVCGDRSQVQIVETYVSAPGQKHFTNAVTEIVAGENAVLDHYKVEEESIDAFHIASMHIHAARSSNVSTHAFTLGGRIVRNDIVAVLDGEGAECTLNGLYVADGERLVDTHTTIDHAKAHCPSHEIYKGILGGRARAVFNGKIIVRIDAQKTDAKQTNRALLLSDNATINTKPQLEIFADDVKCTHGAAIGQLDEDAIFYLRARGLTYLEARDMLIHAFAGEILDRVKIEPLRGRSKTSSTRSWRGTSRRSTRHDARRRTAARASSTGRRAGAGGLPDSAAAGTRQAARLSRQRRDDAEAASRHRRDRALLHRVQRQRAPRRARAERSRERGLRAGAAQGRRVLQRAARRARSSLRATRPRASTSSRTPSAGRASAPATRCSSPRWSITRTSCRGSCCARSAARGCASRRWTIAAS